MFLALFLSGDEKFPKSRDGISRKKFAAKKDAVSDGDKEDKDRRVM